MSRCVGLEELHPGCYALVLLVIAHCVDVPDAVRIENIFADELLLVGSVVAGVFLIVMNPCSIGPLCCC